jgi:hypothetical protein
MTLLDTVDPSTPTAPAIIGAAVTTTKKRSLITAGRGNDIGRTGEEKNVMSEEVESATNDE